MIGQILEKMTYKRQLVALIILILMVGCAVKKGIIHEVKQGETLWRISRVYDVKLDTLLKVNKIEDPRKIRPGTNITIPGAKNVKSVPNSPQRTAKRKQDAEETQTSEQATENKSRENTTGKEEKNKTNSSEDKQNSKVNPTGNDSEKSSSTIANYFDPVWPCDGRLASRFDPKKGPSHRGIRIHTSDGTLVNAAEKGNIKLAGSWKKMPELGKIVIIFHSNDLTTVYAHLKSLKVSEGETVNRNETLGRVGSSGNVDRPMCYFEVRYQLEPRDPLIFLGEPT